MLLGYFEVQYLWFSRSCMSGCRAVRLAQILGLDRLDGKSGQRVTIPPPRDWCEAEERRRTFWTVFILDRQESSTTDWFILIDWRRVSRGVEEASFMCCAKALAADTAPYRSKHACLLRTRLSSWA